MRIEHTNITVPDIKAATAFLMTAFPEMHVRGEGGLKTGRHWRHVGTDETYIALQQEGKPTDDPRKAYIDNGINHIGFVVEDVNAIRTRLEQNGYKLHPMGVSEEGRTSVYFYDHTGLEWEFVEYHTSNVALRNNYSTGE